MKTIRIAATAVATLLLIALIVGQPSAAPPTRPVYVGVQPGAVPPVTHRVDGTGRIVTDASGQPAVFPNPDRRPVTELPVMGPPAYCPKNVDCRPQ
ncbi:MAG TPA: hypothetical protein VM841_10085 [Actinomycetota bacterium]|nr:hypothetical protein [Actinomycetota bacterium]